MLSGFFKVIFYSFLIYLIYLLIRFFKTISSIKKTQHTSKRLSGTMVKDEYCNTYLPKEEAIREVIEGKEYFFCSKECRKKFLEKKKSE